MTEIRCRLWPACRAVSESNPTQSVCAGLALLLMDAQPSIPAVASPAIAIA
jgi:hypothetical protein